MFVVTLVLATAPGRPDGDVGDRIELHVALTPQATLDAMAHDEAGATWPAERALPDGGLRPLELIRIEGDWSLRSTRHEDEPLWRVSARTVRPGEYITLTPPDGDPLTYRIVGVDDRPAAAANDAATAA